MTSILKGLRSQLCTIDSSLKDLQKKTGEVVSILRRYIYIYMCKNNISYIFNYLCSCRTTKSQKQRSVKGNADWLNSKKKSIVHIQKCKMCWKHFFPQNRKKRLLFVTFTYILIKKIFLVFFFLLVSLEEVKLSYI